MILLTTFRKSFVPQRDFDPSNVEDLQELKYFKDNGNWKKGCPFYLDETFLEVPAMCYVKYTHYMLDQTVSKSQSKKTK